MTGKFSKSLVGAVVGAGLLAGCASGPLATVESFEQPTTQSGQELHNIPEPSRQIVASVYAFPDETGQYRQTNQGQAHYSRAVTQGGVSVLIRSLQDAGGGKWFKVLERARLDDVLTERSIIREQRKGAVDRNGNPMPGPKPLLYSGVIFNGGIIGFDTSTVTGGAGARFLGIGGNTEYQEDLVTVYLRAVNSQTGEVWHSVVATKRIYSMRLQADVFRFVSTDEIFEFEAGVTRNEPRLHALRQAVEKAVFAMVMEGSERGLWSFADDAEGRAALDAFHKAQRLRAEDLKAARERIQRVSEDDGGNNRGRPQSSQRSDHGFQGGT